MLSKNLKNIQYLFCVKKKIFTAEATRQIILNTTSKVAQIAGITLGPKGRNILIQNQVRQQPRITKDGVTVVKHFNKQQPFQNAVSELIKKSVNNTNKYAGDGTTSSTIMIGEIVSSALRKLLIGTCTSRQIRQGLKIARTISLDYLDAVKREILSQEELYNVAMISTNGEERIARLISEAVWRSQMVSVEKSNTKDTYLEYFSGLKIGRGVPYPEFKNLGDKIVYNYPLVVVSRTPLQSTKQIIKLLQYAKKSRKQLMIFSEKVSQNVFSTLVYNNRKKVVQSCAIEIPSYGQQATKYLQLIAQSTGALMFNKFTKPIEEIQWQDLGKAVKITVDEFETEIRGKKKQDDVSAIIYAGGNTQAVALQFRDKIIDALNSVSTAKRKGIVAGAGLTYWNLADLLDQYQGDFEVGIKVLAQALRGPRKRLYQTVDPQKKPLESSGWVGFNIKTQKQEDMFESGIVDSVQVCKNVIIDSISLASQLIEVEIGVIRTETDNDKLMDLKTIKAKYAM